MQTAMLVRSADVFEGQRRRGWGRPVPRRSQSEVLERLLQAGQRQRDADCFLPRGQRGSTALLLGGLTVSMVVNVAHVVSLPGKERAPLARTLAGLTGALFIEWLATHVEPDLLSALARPAEDFAANFERSVGLPPQRAWARFLQFVAQTEGRPGVRLAGTIYRR